MPPYNTDERVQGLHYLSVVEAAKVLVAGLSANKLLWEKFRNTPIESKLHDLVREVNRLSMFERRAAVRGTVKATEGEDVARAVKEARDRPDLSLESKDLIAEAADANVDDMFGLDDENDTSPEAFAKKIRGRPLLLDPHAPAVEKEGDAPAPTDSDLDSFEV